jgi:hypothetical protein
MKERQAEEDGKRVGRFREVQGCVWMLKPWLVMKNV